MRALLLAALALALTAAPAAAAPELVKLGDFTDPVHVASPPNDARVFVAEKDGRIRIVGGGTFLDATNLTDGSDEERGLLSMAFPPDYATSGRFYVFLTATGDGRLRVLEFQRSANPDVADPNSLRELLAIPHGPQYHNGGQLQFGPDGMLYVSTGDGHDSSNAQNTGSLLGKILRLDPATGGAAAGNPYGRVWAFGLRNPWRFSFDRATGDLLIGDVGDVSYEEINWSQAPDAGRGVNYGWPCNEGPNGAATCGQRATLSHGRPGFCAIVGGYVVRDPGLPTLNGRYLYGDYCATALWSAALGSGPGTATGLAIRQLSSFGEDSCGHIYAASLQSDAVYRLQDGALSACPSGGPGPATPAGDTTKPKLSIALPKLGKALERRSLRVAVRCNEACRVSVAPRLRRVRLLSTRHRSLAAGKRAVFTVKLNRRTMRKLRTTIERRGSVRVEVKIRARDAAGNTRVVTKRGRLKG